MKKHRRGCCRRSQGGFSLVDVMVSLLVFSFGVLGMATMQAQASKMSVEAEDRARAALLANELVSQMWLRHTLGPPPDVIAAWQSRVRDRALSGLVDADGSVTTSPSDGLAVATVTVRWKSPARRGGEASGIYTTQVAMP